LAVVLLVWGLPRIAGVGWMQILQPLRALSPVRWLLLAGLQLRALWAFTFTITAALQGISNGGTVGYFVLYFVLFRVCLQLTGLVTDTATMLAAFALGRLLTAVAVTPGGIGVVEAGSVALLVALSTDPAQAAGGCCCSPFPPTCWKSRSACSPG
jgi:hypothetical protein